MEAGGWGERGECLVRSPEKVTQVQGFPINVGSVREGEGKETEAVSSRDHATILQRAAGLFYFYCPSAGRQATASRRLP